MWGEAVHTAVYIKNRLSHRAVKITPYEELHGEKPFIKHLQSFGRKCYVHVLPEQRKAGSKLLLRAKEGRLVGYVSSTDKIYRVYISSEHRIVESRQVRFASLENKQSKSKPEQDEEESTAEETPKSVVLPLRSRRRVQQSNQRLQQQESQESQSDEESQSEQEESESDVEDEFAEAEEPQVVIPPPPADPENYEIFSPEQTPEPLSQPRRNPPREGRRAPDRYGALAMEHALMCAADVMDESLTHHAAMNSAQSEQWIAAEQEKLNSLAKAET
jgi:hypothetical protein